VAAGFTPDDVRRLGALARLELTDDEVASFAEQLSGILAFVAEVEAFDASAELTDTSGPAAPSPLREDEVRPPLTRDDVLSGAPEADRAAGLITVPRVLTA
jgi:aspartyl-tRNA(Asn)/glutamyl-tRNA(Gln) amidotransferase subunit C